MQKYQAETGAENPNKLRAAFCKGVIERLKIEQKDIAQEVRSYIMAGKNASAEFDKAVAELEAVYVEKSQYVSGQVSKLKFPSDDPAKIFSQRQGMLPNR